MYKTDSAKMIWVVLQWVVIYFESQMLSRVPALFHDQFFHHDHHVCCWVERRWMSEKGALKKWLLMPSWHLSWAESGPGYNFLSFPGLTLINFSANFVGRFYNVLWLIRHLSTCSHLDLCQGTSCSLVYCHIRETFPDRKHFSLRDKSWESFPHLKTVAKKVRRDN